MSNEDPITSVGILRSILKGLPDNAPVYIGITDDGERCIEVRPEGDYSPGSGDPGGPSQEHDCLDNSGVIVCASTEPHHRYSWMARPVTQQEIDDVPEGYDLRECRVCHRRFTERCNFDFDFA